MMVRFLGGVAVLAVAGAAAIASPGGQTAPAMRFAIRPGVMNPQTGGTVDIVERIPVPAGAQWQPSFELGTKAPGMAHTQQVEGLTIADRRGALPGTFDRDDGEGRFVWKAARPADGEVTVRYRLPVVNDHPIGGGPPTYLRIEGDTISGVFNMLLLLPDLKGNHPIAIDWDLGAMGAGAAAVSTFGEGNTALGSGSPNRLAEAFFMAGHMKRYPASGKGTFSAVWPGDPGFDVLPSLAYCEKLYRWMSHFFGDTALPPYRMFMRYNPAANAGGGAAFPHSFLWTYGEGLTGKEMETILGHEEVHTWTAGISKWFDEGDAVYYQQRLPWRAGMRSTDAYLRDINLTAARYYTNELIHMPMAEVMDKYWNDKRKIVIPYDRGAIYFANVDAQIRRNSGGKRSVDDLMRAVVAKLRNGEQLDDDSWVALVRGELGAEGVQGYRDMMAGKTILPPSDAYGPCFRRVDATIRRYNLGYTVKQPTDGRGAYYVENLVAGSEAAKAGIRNGDQIVLRTNTDGAQRDPELTLTVKITRDGKTFPVTYLPRAEPVPAYQWVREPSMPEGRCRP